MDNNDLEKIKNQNKELFQNYLGNKIEEDLKKKKEEEFDQQMDTARIRDSQQQEKKIKDSGIYDLVGIQNENKNYNSKWLKVQPTNQGLMIMIQSQQQQEQESFKFSISRQSFKKIYSIISNMFDKQESQYGGKNFFFYVNEQYGKLYEQLIPGKDQDFQFRTILDFEFIGSKYENLNKSFIEVFQDFAQKYYYNQKMNNDLPFDQELFDEICNQIITQYPFQKITLRKQQLQQHLINYKNYSKISDKFIDLINKDLVHFANIIFGSKKEKTVSGIGMCVNRRLLREEDQKTLFFNLLQVQTAQVCDVCQIQYYFYIDKIVKIIDKFQNKYKQNLTQQFEIYFALAFVRKFFSICDFYGVPLQDDEFKNFKNAMINMQQMYVGDFQIQQDSEYEPYKTVVQMKPQEYLEAQIIQKALINSKSDKKQ